MLTSQQVAGGVVALVVVVLLIAIFLLPRPHADELQAQREVAKAAFAAGVRAAAEQGSQVEAELKSVGLDRTSAGEDEEEGVAWEELLERESGAEKSRSPSVRTAAPTGVSRIHLRDFSQGTNRLAEGAGVSAFAE